MYAIAFDLDQETFKRVYPGQHHQNAYDDICRVLGKHGFNRQQGSVYFGHRETTPVHCVLAVQDVSAKYAWFKFAVRDIRMLRIEENSHLLPAIIGQGELPFDAADPAA